MNILGLFYFLLEINTPLHVKYIYHGVNGAENTVNNEDLLNNI